MTAYEVLMDDVVSLVESVVLRHIREDEPLIDTGLVDSVLAVEIVISVAVLYGVRIPTSEIPIHLASVTTLCMFISRQILHPPAVSRERRSLH